MVNSAKISKCLCVKRVIEKFSKKLFVQRETGYLIFFFIINRSH